VRDRTVLPNCGPVTGPVRREDGTEVVDARVPRVVQLAVGVEQALSVRADHRLPDSFAGSLASVFVTVGKSLDGSHDIVERVRLPAGIRRIACLFQLRPERLGREASIAAVRQRVRQHFVDALVVLAVRIRGFEVAEPPGVLRVVSERLVAVAVDPFQERVVPDRRHLVETDIAREFPEYLAQESIDGARVRGLSHALSEVS
jgi:hypothetical protein